MNIARKIILSVWIPFMIIFPISKIPTTIFSSKASKHYQLSDNPWFWYVSLLATGIYLLVLWEKSK